MMNAAITSKVLAEATSFIQVEYGIHELRSCWQGFVDTSNFYGETFKSRKQICEEFTHALADYIEYLNQPASQSLGS